MDDQADDEWYSQQKNGQVQNQNPQLSSEQNVCEDVSPTQEIVKQISTENKNGDDIMKPKDGLSIFNAIRPNCICNIKVLSNSQEEIFSAVFIGDDKIIASGLGRSAQEAKLTAAENGIINFVLDMMKEEEEKFFKNLELGNQNRLEEPSTEKLGLLQSIFEYASNKNLLEKRALTVDLSEPLSTFMEENEKVNGLLEEFIKSQKPTSALSWKAVENYSINFVMNNGIAILEKKGILKEAAAGKPGKNDAKRKILPSNAADIHPPVLLDAMFPGINAIEIRRDNNVFELGYKINDATYTGVGHSKKEAKKMAAMKALAILYDIKYPQNVKQ